jgi:hypothetical protein
VQLLRDTLDVVEPVDANDDLDTLEAALKLFDPLLNRLPLQVLRKFNLSDRRNAE